MRVAEQAQKGYEHFVEAWRPHAPKEKARGRIPIESVFATVRHRTVRTKGSLSSKTARLMVFKLVMAAARTWRRLKGQNQLPKLIAGAGSWTELRHRNEAAEAACSASSPKFQHGSSSARSRLIVEPRKIPSVRLNK